MSGKSDEYCEKLNNKYKQFVDYNKPKVLKFLQNVPFEEFTNELKNKLGVDNLNIKYEIKEDDTEGRFGYSVRYKSNDLTEDSKFLSTILRECRLMSFGSEWVVIYLQDGRKYNNDIFVEEFDTFDVNQNLKFCLVVGMYLKYYSKDFGENGIGFGYAKYTEDGGWEFNWKDRK